jgi:hypothetical protein
MLHGRFTYKDQPAWHTSERTLAVPDKSGTSSVLGDAGNVKH